MNRIINIVVLFAAFTILTGCGYKEGVKNEAQKAYLYFTGNTQNVEIKVDDNSFMLTKQMRPDDLFQITPGKHTVIAIRDNQVILQKDIYVNNGISKEIQLPN